jgi:TRAP-type C4-dicarboxylate transport system permease small subunit
MAAAGLAQRVARAVAAASLGAVFAIFILAIAARHLFGVALGWTDEAVTLLAVWSMFWTAAFVLRWSDFIAFDVLFGALPAGAQRVALLAGCAGLILLLGAAMPGMVDYTLFLWRERTDSLELRLDVVFAVFPAFFAAILLRLGLTVARLLGPGWRAELARWAGAEAPS